MPQQTISLTDEQVEIARRLGKITGKSLSGSIGFVFDLGVPPAIEYCTSIQEFMGRSDLMDELLALVVMVINGNISESEIGERVNSMELAQDKEEVLRALYTINNLVKRSNGNGNPKPVEA